MGTQKPTRRTDSILGAVCGLGLAAATWTIVRAPAPIEPAGWLLLACGLPIGSRSLPLSRISRNFLTLAFVMLCLVTHGIGAAVLARIGIWLVAQLRGGMRRSVSDRIGKVFELSAGAAVTVLAGLGYLAIGGTVPIAATTTVWAGVASFVALYTVAERVSNGLAGAVPGGSTADERWPGWGTMTAGNIAAGAAAASVGLLFGVSPVAAWGLPPLIAVTLFSIPAIAFRGAAAGKSTGPIDRALARALAVALSDEKPPPLQIRRMTRIALDLGRANQMTGEQLDQLEIAAWTSEVDRLEMPPPPRHWPEAGRFGGRPPARFEPLDALERLGLPGDVIAMVRHVGERWDGSGTPDGLSGARIPLGSRVLAVARDFVSMTTPGNGRLALSPQRALAELRNEGGRAFDPRVVDTLARAQAEKRVHGEDDPITRSDDDLPTRRAPRVSERLVEARTELDTLYGIRNCARLPIDLEETLVLVMEKLRPLIPHAMAVLWAFEPEKGDLRPRFVRGAAETALRGLTLPANRTFSGRVARLRRAGSYQASGAPPETGWDLDGAAGDPRLTTLSTALAAPLIAADRCLGALTVYDRSGRRFDTAERRALVAVAAQVAEALAAAPRPRPAVLDSLTDPLTGLPNGRYLEIFAGDLTPAATGEEAGFGLLAFRVRDLDRVYERAGVTAGERLLGVLARRLAAHCVPSEVPVRYGHDLFLVLSPVGAQDALVRRWDHLLRATEGTALELNSGQCYRPSLASAHAGCPIDGADLDDLLEVLGTRLGLAFDRGHKVVPFRAVESVG